MNTIRIGTYDIQLKSSWEEMHARDLQFVGRMFPFEDNAKFHIKVFLHFCKLKYKPWLGYLIYDKVQPQHLHNILTLNGTGSAFAFLFEIPIIKTQLFKYIQIGFTKYYGPDDQLINLRMGEFKIAEKALSIYLNNKDEEFLNTFVTALYREKSKEENNSDVRKPYSQFDHDSREKVIATLPIWQKHAVMLNYMGMRNFMFECNRSVIDRSERGNSDNDWGTVISALAGSAINIISIEEMPVWTVLAYIKDSIKIAKEQKSKQAKQ